MTKVENKIYEARLKGISINQLDKVDFISQLLDSVIAISAITGHALPQEPTIAKKLIELLSSHLLEYGYENITLSELVLSATLNCPTGLKMPSGVDFTPVELFGNYISVHYVAKLLSFYITLRTMFDNQLKNIIDGF